MTNALANPTTLSPGALIDRDGVFALSMTEYHGQPTVGPSVSSSGLRTIWADSPAHFWCRSRMNPARLPEEDKPHFTLGRLAHRLLLEGRTDFDREFVVRPEQWSDWRSKDAKAWRESVQASGLTVITQEDLELVTGMARSLAAHPMVKAGILDGDVERSLIFKDPETGVWLKSRPDVIPNHSGDLADLKTCQSVATDALQKSLGGFGYQMQAALAGAALKAAAGIDMETFSFVWVEKAPPHCVRVTTLTAEDLLRGRLQNEAATRIFAECCRTGNWPGPGGDAQDAEFLSISPWSAKSIDERLELLKQTAPDNDAHPITHAAE